MKYKWFNNNFEIIKKKWNKQNAFIYKIKFLALLQFCFLKKYNIKFFVIYVINLLQK